MRQRAGCSGEGKDSEVFQRLGWGSRGLATCSGKDREGKGTSLLEGFWRSVDAITGGGKGCRLEGQISSSLEVRMIRETQEEGSQEGEEDQRRG